MTNSGIWNPQDDLLLKNAIEAGASLEALAKGAIKFSRRYSYKELKDRWHLLLYDPDVSALSSVGMFELELSGTYPSAKSIKSDNYKAYRDFPEMRKRGSIRKQYYAMRKKARMDFFSSADHLFLDVPSSHQNDNQGSNSREHHHEIFIQNDIGLQEDELDILRSVFPETMGYYSSHFRDTTNGYPAECTMPIRNEYRNGILRNECPLDFFNSVTEDERDSPMGARKCFDMSRAVSGRVQDSGVCEYIKEPDLVQVLPGKRLPRSSEDKQLAASSSCHDNSRSTCGFQGTQNFTSPSSDGNCLQVIEFPSPEPIFPLWMEDCSIPVCIRDQDTDGNFVDLSVALLNLVNEDEMTFMGANEQDAIDEPLTDYLPAFDQIEGKVDCEAAIMDEETTPTVSNCIPPTKLETIASCPLKEQSIVRHLDDNAPSVINENVASIISGICTEFHEPDCSVICCTLNTVDLDVPCNDDIFLLIHPSSAFSFLPPSSGDALDMTSSASGDARVINLSSKEKDSLDSLQCYPDLRCSQSQDIQLCNPYLDCVVKPKEPKAPIVNASKAPESSDLHRSSNGVTDRLPEDNFSIARGEGTQASLEEMAFSKEGGLLEEHVSQKTTNGAASDPEESQSDDEVPCTSDVETMILGMDLDLSGEENSTGVSYLSEENKRKVMRLEHCVQSVLRRALKSQEAFAILYGRRLKHYIRNSEVVLGRSADDDDVDIDLRKERRGNKLSRRQAIIKMDSDGSFSLKNIGKSTIYVNGTRASSGQLLFLSSGCLIEIAGMSFVFEINKKHVRTHGYYPESH